MPQELRVVRCFQCSKFQVDIVKKANKWACKVCGVKQSLMKEFFRGSGKECRNVVQELAARNIAMDKQEADTAEHVLANNIKLPNPSILPVTEPLSHGGIAPTGSDGVPSSKWDSYMSKGDEEEPSGCLELDRALAQVSSTSFEREKVNGGGIVKSKWNEFQQTSDDVSVDDHVRDIVKPTDSYNVHTKSTSSHTFGNTSANNRSRALPDFHHKKSAKQAPQRGTFAPKSNADRGSFVSNSGAPVDKPTTSEVSNKRKHSQSSGVPMMNFGKRPNSVKSSVTIANENCPQFESMQHVAKESAVSRTCTASSKWAKFVTHDEETNENIEEGLIPF